MIELHQVTAALYLAAGLGGVLGLVLPSEGMSRGAVWGLGLGAFVHALAFVQLHGMDDTPPLTHPGAAMSLMAWMGVVFLLGLMAVHRIRGLAAVAGPLAFGTVFWASLRLATPVDPALAAEGSLPHAHVLLASAGLAFLGVASMASLFYLIEYRRLKRKRIPTGRSSWPSLEALDRANVVALSVGFPILTLGVVSGMLWLRGMSGDVWRGTSHEIWTAMAWFLYCGLVLLRIFGSQGGRQAAASAVGGFAFLLFAVVGVRWLA